MEIFYRIGNYLQKKVEKTIVAGRCVKADLISAPAKILPAIKNHELYSTRIKIFDRYFDYAQEIDWNLDIFKSIRLPLIFSKDINILKKEYNSAKYIWEINRLLFLPQICLNYIRSNDKKYLDLFISINDNWIDNNPYLLGINWYSNIEVNIRLINWFLSWEILNVNELMTSIPELKEFVHNRWLHVIYLHCRHSYKNPSRYSSANNHLISEYAGLFIATSLWKFKESARWNAYAKKGLETEIQKQHSENGINKEEAAEYIQFITDFFLIAFLVGEKTNNSFSPEYKQMLGKIFQYIYRFTDIKGNFPNYGDEDDGRVIRLENEEDHNNFRSLLAAGSIIFKDPGLKSKSNGFDTKNHVLFGDEGRKVYDSLGKINPVLQSCMFRKEGHFFLRKQIKNEEVYIHFNAAPLGYLSIAAHGHSDALSLILRLDGKEILVDSGTYAYHTDLDWRQYFIGTIAHNTIRINHKNQALNGGPTLWLNHYKIEVAEAVTNENYDKIVACHDGYRKLGLWHTRELFFNKKDNTLSITDTIECKSGKEYFVEFPLHLHPDLHPFANDHDISLLDSHNQLKIRIHSDPGFDVDIIKGSDSPILGWYSKSFYFKEPAYVIYQTLKANNSILIKTGISIC